MPDDTTDELTAKLNADPKLSAENQAAADQLIALAEAHTGGDANTDAGDETG